MKLRTRDYKRSWTVEEAVRECGEFGNWEIMDVECYVCEREEPELMKWCKSVKRAGGLSEYLKSLKEVREESKGGVEVMDEVRVEGSREEDKRVEKVDSGDVFDREEFRVVSFVGIEGIKIVVSDKVVSKGLEVVRGVWKKEGSKVRGAMEDLVRGIWKREFLMKYRKRFWNELRYLVMKEGFVLYRVRDKDRGDVWIQLVYRGERGE